MDTGVWVGIASAVGVTVGALATAWLKVSGAWSANKRARDRDAVADYQHLLDLSELARTAAESARIKMTETLNATLIENLRLKAIIGDYERGRKPDA